MTSKRIAIVDPYSSGALLAAEIQRRGCQSVQVQSTAAVPALYRSSVQRHDFVATVRHQGVLDATCRQLRALDVRHVLAGCELGVELADQLSERLGLPANGSQHGPARRDKFLMVEAVRAHGLATADHFTAINGRELRDRIGGQRRWPGVVKPLASTAADGVRLCHSAGEVLAAFTQIHGRRNAFGQVNAGVVVEEFLDGPEYAVDTVSCQGRHRLAAIWKYGKEATGPRSLGTESFALLPCTDALRQRLFGYVAGVLDSLGIRHGPAHCEVVCAAGGPRLVEVGARLNGGHNPEISRYSGGRSQVELTLDACLDPEQFLANLNQPYLLSRHAMRVFLLPARTGLLQSRPDLSQLEALPSFHSLRFSPTCGGHVGRIAGWVILVHADKSVIDRDHDRIRQLESAGFYQIKESASGQES